MGCTSSTAAGGGSSSGVKLSDMGSRKGVATPKEWEEEGAAPIGRGSATPKGWAG
eukprot:CAMPEP_0185823616 /NCGR_PEP_ID=MMETSP1322-20130828/28455_1 /TAXON_ID=265543 /ORGANISM="Minutocellus polymorphus, Strain RCC2270" /LENGTH=54 /DNA_ID=CAMNT_0028521175 /DNA_START=16 /DNA_END=177 /DNA_ORIENTATION=+